MRGPGQANLGNLVLKMAASFQFTEPSTRVLISKKNKLKKHDEEAIHQTSFQAPILRF